MVHINQQDMTVIFSQSQQAYDKAIGPIKWLPQLGGITLEKGQARTVTLTSLSGVGEPSTPTSPPAGPPPATQPAR